MTWLYVAMGGALGSCMRYGIGIWLVRHFGQAFPYGTLLVNVFGALCIGAVAQYLIRYESANTDLKSFLMVGVLGGFTTFSAFSLEVIALYQKGEMSLAAFYVLASVILSLLGVLLGMWCIKVVA